jgi:glycosyltransferase involved in cell wall biosynthesis
VNVATIFPLHFGVPHGADLRFRLLIDYLRGRGHRVEGLAFGGEEEVLKGDVSIRQFARNLRPLRLASPAPTAEEWGNRSRAAYLLATRIHWLGTLARGHQGLARVSCTKQEFDIVSHFYRHHLERGFRRAIYELLEGKDILFLEYVFFADLVLPIARELGVPVILSNHDSLAEAYFDNPSLRRLVWRRELRAAREAGAFFCVSEANAAVFKREGVTTHCIVNPIDAAACRPETRQIVLDTWARKYPFLRENFCFFVGSRLQQNIDAADFVRECARRLPQVHFAIAGGCANPGQASGSNLHELGYIPADFLRVLYSRAAVVLIPLLQGSGTSLKCIEALAYGKTLLTTSIGSRGYPVTSEKNAVICDDLSLFPRKIEALIADPKKRRFLEQEAKNFAADYDYRKVLQAYDPIIERLTAKQAAN